MYLAVHETSMGCVLDQHDESGKNGQAIYYLSNKFTDYELCYSSLKKTYCASVCVIAPLYVISYAPLIFRMDPLKYLFEELALSRRLSRWHLFLAESILLMPVKTQ